MIEFSYGQVFHLALPELVLAVFALAVLATDLLLLRDMPVGTRRFFGAFISCVGCAGALFATIAFHPDGALDSGMMVMDPLTRIAKIAVLVIAFFAIGIAGDTQLEDHLGEYFALMLMATAGMTLMVSAEDILMIFLALELTSLSLYILAAYDKRSRQSAEAALKYFLFGGMSAAFLLFGLSLVYGLSGSTHLGQIGVSLAGQEGSPLAITAVVMIAVGFGFKVAVVPFHLWAPDVYEGAPTSSTAFIASGSKAASFFVFAKFLVFSMAATQGDAAWRQFVGGWMPVVAVLALLSMILGNFAALGQSRVKRLLAYSAVAHGGYTLVGILGASEAGINAVLYYSITYALATIGAFAIVNLVERQTGSDRLEAFAGLGRRSPLLGLAMMIFVLSLAGIPPLPGFFGKFALFAAALDYGNNLGHLWLVVIGIAMSAVSLYYYLQILKQIFVVETESESPPAPFPFTTQVAASTLALMVLLLGCAPDLLMAPLAEAMKVVVLR